ncbi:MAG: tripartite tricarboxylate transporter substrate binding protein [Vicinamibacterales bacterium]
MRAAAAILGLALAIGATACNSQTSRDSAPSYPARDVTIVVPFGAGGGSDVLSRTIANVIGDLKLVPVNLLVENRPGSSGAIGYTYVAKQSGNPYTLATVSVSFFTTPLLGASEVTYRHFTPVAAIAMSPYIMAVRAASPIRGFDDVKKARRLTTGTVGVVSDPVLLARLLHNATGVTIDAVPFDGEGEVMTATLGGHIDFMLGNPGEVLPQIQAGTLRPIAVSTPARLPSLSEVPSFTELGYNIEHVQLRGVVMPPGVPPDVVTFWEGALRRLAESEQWKRDYLDRFRDEPRFVGSKEFGQLLESTNGLYMQLMTELGLIK